MDVLAAWEVDLDDTLPPELTTVVTLQPKEGPANPSATRPIALLAGPMRVWAKYRRHQVEEWEKTAIMEEHWACTGKPVDLAMYEHSLRVASAHSCGHWAAALYMDLQKFYDSVHHGRMDEMVTSSGFPPRIWRLAAKLYTGPRVLTWFGRTTQPICVRGSFIPGCPLATSLTRALLLGMVQHLHDLGPPLTITNVVDDIGAACEGSRSEVQRSIVQAGRVILDWLAWLELPLNPGKSLLLASDVELSHAISRDLNEPGITAVQTARQLGIGAHVGKRR
eukprot:6239342-Amphidinium_carterae.1